MADRQPRGTRSDYARFDTVTTRWMDNDVYGHANNVVYYGWFDTVVNRLLIEAGVLDVRSGQVIGLVVETGCRCFASVGFPDRIEVGVRVARLGTSSVRYEVGVFRNDESEASAEGHFVHVYVERVSQSPIPLPDDLRAFLATMAA